MNHVIPGDIIPEDITKAARVKDTISIRHPPWQSPLRSARTTLGELKAGGLPVHQFPASDSVPNGNSICGWPKVDTAVVTMPTRAAGAEPTPALDSPLDPNPNLRAYRRRTVNLLRRYLRYSLETG